MHCTCLFSCKYYLIRLLCTCMQCMLIFILYFAEYLLLRTSLIKAFTHPCRAFVIAMSTCKNTQADKCFSGLLRKRKIKHCLKRFPDFPELLSTNFLMYTRRKPSGQTEESLTIGELKTHTTGRNLEDNFEEILKTNRKGRKFSSLHRLRRRMGRAGTVD